MTCFDFLLSMFFQQSAYHMGFKPLVKSHLNIKFKYRENATKFEKKIFPSFSSSTLSSVKTILGFLSKVWALLRISKHYLFNFKNSLNHFVSISYFLRFIEIQIWLQKFSGPIVPRTKHQPCKCKECFNVYK